MLLVVIQHFTNKNKVENHVSESVVAREQYMHATEMFLCVL